MAAGAWTWKKVAEKLPPQKFEIFLIHKRPDGGYSPQKLALEGVIYGNAREFYVNLKNAKSGDVFFRFDPLYNVKYSLRKGGAREQQGDLPYQAGKPFVMELVADGPNIDINFKIKGEEVYKFTANDPLRHVTCFEIIGDVDIHTAKRDAPLLAMPYYRPIQGLTPPERLKITGMAFSGAKREFSVSLLAPNGNVIFLFNPKFNDGIVLRTQIKKEKIAVNSDKDGGLPFALDRVFNLEIVAAEKHLECYVDGTKFCTYQNVTVNLIEELKTVSNVKVDGDVQLYSFTLYPEEKLTLPFSNPLSGFTPPQSIKIVGTPTAKPGGWKYFEVLLYAGNDCYFTIWANFYHNYVGRSTWTDGKWQRYETEGAFPFEMGKQFLLELVAREKKIEIFIDGRKHSEFEERDDLSKIDKVVIPDKCLTLQSVTIGEQGTGAGQEKDDHGEAVEKKPTAVEDE